MNKGDARILLAEDEPSLQFLFEKQLKSLGYHLADVAENGLVAVEKAIQKPHHIIFMDVRMPELNGLLATQLIRDRELHLGRRTTIVGMTAFAHRDRCLSGGMDDFLQKPVMLHQLGEMIERWLKVPQSAPAARPISVSPNADKYQDIDDQLERFQRRLDDLRKQVGLD
jgi:CheY-like chemotaxis protein